MMYRIKYLFKALGIGVLIFLFSNISIAKEKAVLIFNAGMTEIGSDTKGGYPELAQVLKQHRQSELPVFFVFGGDSLSPSPLSALDRGTHIIDLLNSLEPDAMGVDKREFGFLEDELSLRAYEAAFPIVASNIKDTLTQTNLDGLMSSVIVQQGQYKLGIISVLDQHLVEEYALTRIRVLDEKKAIEKESSILRNQGAELIVLLYSTYKPVISSLLDSNIIDLSLCKDIYFDYFKNSEQKRHPRDIHLSLDSHIITAKLKWKKNKPETLKVDSQVTPLNQYPKDPKLLSQVISYTDRLSALLDQKIGMLKTTMDTGHTVVRTEENTFANFITDAMKNYTKADVALLNSGSIRGEMFYQANTFLTRRDISKEIPFRNKVVLLEVTGEQIINALENGLSIIKKVKGRFPQVSGLNIKYNSLAPSGQRVKSVLINGRPLERQKNYTLATTNYLADGGDGYSSFKQSKKLNFDNQMSRLIADLVIDEIIRQQNIWLKNEGRLVDVGNEVNE